jgi:hypothetical protein
MDNSYLPPGSDPQDHERTQEFGPAGAQSPQPGGDPGQAWNQPAVSPGQAWNQPAVPPGQAWGQPAGPPGQAGRASAPCVPAPRRRRGLWWGAGLALVALLVGGSAFAITKVAASNVPAGPTGQAAALNTMLSNASSPASVSASNGFAEAGSGTPASAAKTGPCQARAAKLKTSGHPLAAARALLRCRGALARLRFIGGLHGTFTFKNKKGITTLAYERGDIQSVSGSDVVVKAADGTTWTWVLESNTVIREGGKKVASSALSGGQQIFAAGPVVNGTYQARLFVARASSASSSPAS